MSDVIRVRIRAYRRGRREETWAPKYVGDPYLLKCRLGEPPAATTLNRSTYHRGAAAPDAAETKVPDLRDVAAADSPWVEDDTVRVAGPEQHRDSDCLV